MIICGETGCGKSTQIPHYIWREQKKLKGTIICAQPKNSSVISLVKYVSSEVGSTLGDIVGYQVGLTKKNVKKYKNSLCY